MPKYSAHHLTHIVDYRKRRRAQADVDIKPIPTKPEEMTWRDYVIMLLHIGAELEHGLMVQYLYAAYSLGGDDLSREDQAEVHQWQDLILTVAREEMGHLLTVQNLLCLLGGPISFDREEFPWETPFYPFPFSFKPLTRETLAAFIFAEMPGNFDTLEAFYEGAAPGTEAAQFLKDIPFIETVVKGWVENDDARPVGEVYHLIHDILANPDLIPDSDFRPETYPLQASWDDWGRGYHPNPSQPNNKAGKENRGKANIIIERVATRTEALYALREISGQGENAELRPTDDEEPSHFERFVEVMVKYDKKLKKVSPKWSPSRPVPINPTTTTPADPENAPADSTPITNAASAKWADLFNCRYRMLLTYLTHTFRLARVVDPNVPNARGAIMHRVFGEMYNLKAISGILVRMPLMKDPDDPRRAGPPFQMPYTLVLPADEIDCWRLHRDIISNSRALCASLMNPAHQFLEITPSEGEPYLKVLCNLDDNAIAWVDTVLAGLQENGGKHS